MTEMDGAAAEERNRTLLVSFAMLQARWDHQNSTYIDNFVPFVAQCVKTTAAPAISTQDVQVELQSRFGLALPQHALQTVLRRGVTKGFFRRENHMYVPDEPALATINIDQDYQRANRGYGQLLDKFLAFVEKRHHRTLTEDEADVAFLGYVTDRAIPIVRSTFLSRDYQPNLESLNELELLVAEFIVHLSRADVQGFDLLGDIVRGCILATALYLPDPDNRGRRVSDLTVYLDTPVIVDLLGLVGEARCEAARELVKLLQDLGARVACFSHTLQETQNLLIASAQRLGSSSVEGHGVNEIVPYAFEKGWGRSKLELQAESVEGDLLALDISVRDAPNYQLSTTLDEDELDKALQSVVGYLRETTRAYDRKSLVATWQLRRGRAQRHLESAGAIFVTSNSNLVRASAQFFEESPNGQVVPVATLDSHLGTVAWLKRPMAAPDLPRRQIIADCFAALNPEPRLLDRFLEIVDQLHEDGGVTEEDYALLRYTRSARQALVEETHGSEGALAVGSVAEILRRAKEAMTKEQRELVLAEAQRRLDAEKRAEAESRRAEAAEQSLVTASNKHAAALASGEERHSAELRRRIGNKAHRRAAWISKGIFVLLALVVILGAGAGLGLIGSGVAAFVVVVLYALLAVRHELFGGSLKDLLARFERLLERKLEDHERRSLGM